MAKKPVKSHTLPRRLLVLFLKLTLSFGALFTFYGLYLDAKVQQRFEGQKWQLPIQVFARPLELYQGLQLEQKQLVSMLKMLGYRQSSSAQRAGEYSIAGATVSFYRRAFVFSDGPVSANLIHAEFFQNKVYQLTDADGDLSFARLEGLQIGRLSADNHEDREVMPLQQIPEMIADTLLLVEDRDFYHHHGVAPLAILRALWTNIQAGRTVQGGSTLTQQLAKNLFLTRERTLIRKVNEAMYALILDYRYSKDQILEAYLNQVYLGQQHATAIHGFGLAARHYFAKPLAELAPHEYALLIGLVKGPSYYNPEKNPARAMERRDLILRLMLEHDLLSTKSYQLAVNQPVVVKKGARANKGRYPAYLDQVKRELKPLLSRQVRNEGLRIYTGLKPLMQEDMETAVEQQLPILEKRVNVTELEAAMVGAEIDTSTITALVGGRRTKYKGFNRAIDAQRQVGSVIKPAVYVAALEQYERYTLGTMLDDKPITFTGDNGEDWSPKNYDEQFRGQVPLLQGLVRSLNVPTVNLGMQVGVDRVRDVIVALGIDESELPRYPSIFLGAVNLTPLQVGQMYHTISNHGAYRPLHAVESITDVNGQMLWEFFQYDEPRLSENAAYLVDFALQQVTETGSAKALSSRFPRTQFAGKTGTTNDRRDSWFVGFDNREIIVSWIGRDDNKTARLTGSSGALNLFSAVQKKRHAVSRDINMPPTISMTKFSLQSGRPLQGDCVESILYPAVQRRMPEPQVCEQESKKWWQVFGQQ